MTQPLLSVRDLKTYFNTREGLVKAVDGASFDVYPGQTVGIVGESGCGKSITMRSILHIVKSPGRIEEGQILFRPGGGERQIDLVKLKPNGREMRSMRGKDIALIPQEPMVAFSPLHTIGNQMIEAITLHQDVNETQARMIAINMLREVGVPAPEQRIDMFSWELSGGLRQRAMIALALSCNPKLLIADEPTTALDVTTQAQILKLLKELQQQRNMAVIMITHDLGVVAQVADYVVVMYLGRVVEQGPVDDIFHNPKHPYTMALLKSMPSVNSEPRTLLPSIKGGIPSPFNRPKGCPFHPRCEFYMPGVCEARVPELKQVSDTQMASCFLYEDESVLAQTS